MNRSRKLILKVTLGEELSKEDLAADIIDIALSASDEDKEVLKDLLKKHKIKVIDMEKDLEKALMKKNDKKLQVLLKDLLKAGL